MMRIGPDPHSCCFLVVVGFLWRLCLSQAFVVPLSTTTSSKTSFVRPLAYSSHNPLDDESHEQRQQRLQLVRSLQKTYYANERAVSPPQHGVYSNLPLYRGDWTELPGFQHDMNVTDPTYTNMLLKVVSCPRPWYFGHVYQPVQQSAFRHLHDDNTAWVGTLMQVSDYRPLDNGELNVVVQALARFSIVETMGTYATVELFPDAELVSHFYEEAQQTAHSFDFTRNDDTTGAACAGAVAQAAEWRSYEFQAVPANATTVPPVAHFDATATPVANDNNNDNNNVNNMNAVHTAIEDYLSQPSDDLVVSECSLAHDDDAPHLLPQEQDALRVERNVWIELDVLAKNLARLDPQANTNMPIPHALLGLLPPTTKWPRGFGLQRYRQKVSRVYTLLQPRLAKKNSKANSSLQQEADQLQTAQGYPQLRRARRLSYMVWALLDTVVKEYWMIEEDDPGDFYGSGSAASLSKQEILELNSTTERLQAALKRIQEINAMLRQVLEMS